MTNISYNLWFDENISLDGIPYVTQAYYETILNTFMVIKHLKIKRVFKMFKKIKNPNL